MPGRDRHTLTLRTKGKSKRWERHVYRWAHAVPLTDSDDALPVNWCDVTVTNDAGKTLYHNAWITDRELTADTVAGWVAAGRARWERMKTTTCLKRRAIISNTISDTARSICPRCWRR